jgi:hypothetical protein
VRKDLIGFLRVMLMHMDESIKEALADQNSRKIAISEAQDAYVLLSRKLAADDVPADLKGIAMNWLSNLPIGRGHLKNSETLATIPLILIEDGLYSNIGPIGTMLALVGPVR